MKLIRGSEMQDFLRCRLRWKYAWVDGYKPKKLNDKLQLGILVHKFLQVFYEMWDYTKAREAMYNEYMKSTDMSEGATDLYNLAVAMTDHYVKHYDDRDEIDIVATELQFAIPISTDFGYTGTIDLVYVRKNRTWGFWDHKTTKFIDKYDKMSDMDRQVNRYWWALQQLASGKGYIWYEPDNAWLPVSVWENMVPGTRKLEAPAEAFYNILLKDVPEAPTVLKNGSLSKDKRQNTTYDLYKRAIANGDVDISYYKDILDHLRDNPREYFRRTRFIRNQTEIDLAMEEFIRTAKDREWVKYAVMNGAEWSPIYRNITPDCSWDCAFKDVCKAGLDGSDVQHLLDTQFIKEEPSNGHDRISN